ncbi:MAG: DUF5134 domain-containing protein [Pseudonocardiaceae bacterium]
MDMGGPSWLADILAVIMLGVAVYCAIRLVLGPVLHRRVERDIDLVHVGMGVAMAGMLVPGLNPWAGHLWDAGWEVIFGVAMVYFLVRGVQGAMRRNTATGHYLPHAVHSGAMIYMFLALPAMASSSRTTAPTLTLVLGLFMVGYAVLLINHITPLTADTRLTEPASLVTASVSNRAASVVETNPNPGLPLEAGQTFPTSPSLLAPRAATTYKIAMSLTMAYMLVTML